MGQPSLVSDAIVMISSLTTVMLTVMKSITEGITVPSLRGLLDDLAPGPPSRHLAATFLLLRRKIQGFI